MAVKNIECQLAQGQIGRYLAGTDMSAEAVTQLELHISECEDCSTFVDDKRKALREMAGQRKAVAYIEETETSPEPAPTPEPAKTTPAQALIQILKERGVPATDQVVLETTTETGPPKGIKWKAFAYSGGLGLVLLLMSHFTANPTALFGERVEAAPETKTEAKPNPPAVVSNEAKTDGDPFTQEPTTTPTTTEPPVTTPEVKAPADPSTELPNAPQKSEAGNQKPEAAASKTNFTSSTPPAPKTRITSRRIRPRSPRRQAVKPATPRRGNSIRVYDENGNPISGA